jgi:hypothetical protein
LSWGARSLSWAVAEAVAAVIAACKDGARVLELCKMTDDLMVK